MSWKDLILTVLLAVLLIVCFSLWGPMEVSAPAPRGRGYEQRGESGLVVSGAGAEIVTVGAGVPDSPSADAETSPAQRVVEDADPYEGSREQPDPLRGYWYGVGAVLMGQIVIILFGRRNDDD